MLLGLKLDHTAVLKHLVGLLGLVGAKVVTSVDQDDATHNPLKVLKPRRLLLVSTELSILRSYIEEPTQRIKELVVNHVVIVHVVFAGLVLVVHKLREHVSLRFVQFNFLLDVQSFAPSEFILFFELLVSLPFSLDPLLLEVPSNFIISLPHNQQFVVSF